MAAPQGILPQLRSLCLRWLRRTVIKEGEQATNWTRLSCHRFRANEVRLQLSVLAYNLGKLWRRLGLPHRIKSWSLMTVDPERSGKPNEDNKSLDWSGDKKRRTQ